MLILDISNQTTNTFSLIITHQKMPAMILLLYQISNKHTTIILAGIQTKTN